MTQRKNAGVLGNLNPLNRWNKWLLGRSEEGKAVMQFSEQVSFVQEQTLKLRKKNEDKAAQKLRRFLSPVLEDFEVTDTINGEKTRITAETLPQLSVDQMLEITRLLHDTLEAKYGRLQ